MDPVEERIAIRRGIGKVLINCIHDYIMVTTIKGVVAVGFEYDESRIYIQ